MLASVRLDQIRLGFIFFYFVRRSVLTANCPTAKNPRAIFCHLWENSTDSYRAEHLFITWLITSNIYIFIYLYIFNIYNIFVTSNIWVSGVYFATAGRKNSTDSYRVKYLFITWLLGCHASN